MSVNSSSPYQSKILGFATRQTRRWVDQGAIALRRLKLVARWSVQAVLYPVYFLFQSGRLLGAQMQQAAELLVPRLKAAVRQTAAHPPDPSAATPAAMPLQLTAETAIHHVLETVRSLDLPDQFSVMPDATDGSLVTGEQAGTIAPAPLSSLSREMHRRWALWDSETIRLGKTQLAALLQHWLSPLQSTLKRLTVPTPTLALPAVSGAGLPQRQTSPLIHLGQQTTLLLVRALRVGKVLAAEIQQWALNPPAVHAWLAAADSSVPETRPIRGVSSLLEPRSLVLVTNHNEILDILTPGQQQQLHRRILWEVAHYARYQKLRLATRQVFRRLQPPAGSAPVMLPVRWFYHLMAWMQTSPLAIAANVFREVALLPPADVPRLSLPDETASTPLAEPRRIAAIPAALDLDGVAQTVHHGAIALSRQIASLLTQALQGVTAQASPISIEATLDRPDHNPSDNPLFNWRHRPRLLPTAREPQPIADEIIPIIPTATSAMMSPSPSVEAVLPLDPPRGLTEKLVGAIAQTLRPIASPTAQAEAALQASQTFQETRTEGDALRHRPDYIDTAATVIGYDRPLRQKILRWLDRCLLWLEDRLLVLWQHLRQWHP